MRNVPTRLQDLMGGAIGTTIGVATHGPLRGIQQRSIATALFPMMSCICMGGTWTHLIPNAVITKHAVAGLGEPRAVATFGYVTRAVAGVPMVDTLKFDSTTAV